MDIYGGKGGVGNRLRVGKYGSEGEDRKNGD